MPDNIQGRAQHDPAIEFLAKESRRPFNDVQSLYDAELAKLAIGARISAFIPIFAFRLVRELLRSEDKHIKTILT